MAIKGGVQTKDLLITKSGYYLIDIQGITQRYVASNKSVNLDNNLPALNSSNSIQAIVSKYYNEGNYTSADTSDGIIYTHTGAPHLIQSLRVRILNPEGALSTDMGTDSTIFLQLGRAQPSTKGKSS